MFDDEKAPEVFKFKFAGYEFDRENFVGSFSYVDQLGHKFTERVRFQKNAPLDDAVMPFLDSAMKLAFLLIGTSYYKAHPTKEVELPFGIDDYQKGFLNTVYTDGLSQYAFENNLTPSDLVDFEKCKTEIQDVATNLPYEAGGALALQSGGKDSILTATILNSLKKDWSALYIGSTETHPAVIDNLGASVNHVVREIDIETLKTVSELPGYLNGHVPVTYILMSIATIQAILDKKSYVITSIGHEGEEPHSIIRDDNRGHLKVNHQWSKTFTAEKLFAEYVHKYIATNFQIGSVLRSFSELRIAELFAKECWEKYGHAFSSCNVANYRQQNNNEKLTWCGSCAKCANSYLIFAPFIPAVDLVGVFGGDLFENPELTDEFKGLLNIDQTTKPFECVGEIEELRQAYSMRQPEYASLPFEVPEPMGFDYKTSYEVQDFVKEYLKG